MKNLAKNILYSFRKKGQLKSYNIKLGYIFHTEKLHDDRLFNQLLRFCKIYKSLTGAVPICTVIPPSNLQLKRDLSESGFSEKDYASRIIELSEHSTIGYHGHFYLDNNPVSYNAIQCNNFNAENLTEQFKNDIRWFEQHQIAHNNIYAGGWWFFNETILQLLLKHGFQFDFSFSRAPFFYNQFSNEVLNKNKIRTGDVFGLGFDNNNYLTCIQNFIGMHTTPFPQDFDRNMQKLNLDAAHPVTGVVNAHDYDLDFANTIKCIEYQLACNKIRFVSFDGLIEEKPVTRVRVEAIV